MLVCGVPFVPIHVVFLRCDHLSGVFPVAVCASLPVRGFMGNDIAGGKINPTLEVLIPPLFSLCPMVIFRNWSHRAPLRGPRLEKRWQVSRETLMLVEKPP